MSELSSAVFTIGEVERALGLLVEAERFAERLDDQAQSGLIALQQGRSLWMLGHSDRAEPALERALAVAESAGDVALRLAATVQRGCLRHDRGDYLEASKTFRDCAVGAVALLRTPLGGAVRATWTYLGWSLAEIGEFAEAIRQTDESLARDRTLDNPYALMLACLGVGMVYVRQGNAAAAMPPLEEGLHVCYRFGLTANTFHGIAASLGAAYALVGRTADAFPLLRKVADQAASHLLGAIPPPRALEGRPRVPPASPGPD